MSRKIYLATKHIDGSGDVNIDDFEEAGEEDWQADAGGLEAQAVRRTGTRAGQNADNVKMSPKLLSTRSVSLRHLIGMYVLPGENHAGDPHISAGSGVAMRCSIGICCSSSYSASARFHSRRHDLMMIFCT